MSIFEDDEKMWNTTYKEQIEGLKISVIKDIEIYKKDGRLQDSLKIQLKEDADDKDELTLLNKDDQYGDLPKYDPFS